MSYQWGEGILAEANSGTMIQLNIAIRVITTFVRIKPFHPQKSPKA